MINARITAGARAPLRRGSIGRNTLFLGTALGCSIAILGAMPGQAWAADECGADVAGVATCNADGVPATDANPYPLGIDYVADPLEDITVILTGAVDIVTVTDDGVTATGVLNYDAEVYVNTGASIDTTQDGILVNSFGAGDGYVYVDTGVTIDAGSRGIAVFANGTGDATVVNYANITTDGVSADVVSDAIVAVAYGGDASVTSTGDLTATAGLNDIFAYGIYANGFTSTIVDSTGDITVTNGNLANLASAGISAIYAQVTDVTQTGNIDVFAATGYAAGIYANGGTTDVDVVGNISVEALGNDVYGILVDGTTSASVTVTGDIYTDQDDYTQNNFGIQVGTFADPVGGNVDITVTGDVYAADGLNVFGVYAMADGDTIITINGTVEVGGGNTQYGTGITAWGTAGGDVTIVADDVLVYQAGSFLLGGGDGINVYTAGIVDITAEDIVTSGYYADGIFVGGVFGISGNTDIDVVSVTTTGLGSDGIDVGGHGIIDVTATGLISTTGENSDGMELSSDLGTVVVLANDITTTGVNADGINAYGFNGVDITVTGQIYAGEVGSFGVNASAENGVTEVNVFDVETQAAGSTGVFAFNTNGDAVINATGYIYTAGAGADGLYAESVFGNAYATSDGEVRTLGASSDAIDAWSASGNAYAYNNGVVTTLGADASGVEAGSGTGYAEAYNSGSVYTFGAASFGLYAYSGADAAAVNEGDVYAYGAGSDAIRVDAGDDAFVSSDGVVYSDEAAGIAVVAGDFATIDIDGGSVYGFTFGVQSTAVSGTTIINDGAISGAGGRAIDVDGGAAYLDNNDTIYGAVDLTDNADHFENDGLWEAYGTSTFGLGSDDVDNDGTTGFSRYQGAASTTTFTGLEFFDNAGTVSGVDQQVNDVLSMPGTTFTGSGASEFEFDVQLGGPGSAADRLVIGSAAGVTELTPNDLLAATPGVLNFGGILVVDSANAAEVGTEFVMDNVDKGFVEYELIFDAATDNWLIVGLPDDEAFEMLALASSSQDFWRRSGDAWTARMQEVRDANPSGGASAGPGGMGRSEGWELWMQAHGGDESFENVGSFTISGFTFGPDLTVDSDWRGFQFGADTMSAGFIWGLTAGFVQQETRFEFDGNSFDFEGWNIGAYAGWNWGGLYLNGLVKGDFYEVDANFHTIPTMASFDGTTWGVQGELGYRWEGSSWFFEPHAQLAWTSTDLDDFSTFGAGFEIDNADSLYGKAGARIGGTFGSGNVVLTPYIGVYAVEEFEGENELTFTSGATSFSIHDEARDSYAQVDFGVTAQTFYGLEGFLKGEWNFSGDADGGAVRLGARWRW